MAFLNHQLREIISKATKKKFPAALVDNKIQIKVEYPLEESHGDYASAIALELGKVLKKNPREVATELISAIDVPEFIEKIEPAGAGFINFFLSPKYLTNLTRDVVADADSFGRSEVGKGKTVLTDSSHPNVAKPMGVHHLLSTIIGNSLNRILAAVGYTVIRDNYLGDWGTQFGKLIYAYKTWGDKDAVKKNPIPELLKLYVKFHEEVERMGEKGSELEDLGRAEFKKLENGDKENHELWQWVRDLSIGEFEKMWQRLGVNFDYIHGESFYEDKMQEVIDMGIKKGIFVEGNGGALIAPFPHEKYPPAIIRKSDGATLYATRDLARVLYWERTWHPALMLNVVDSAQQMYFQQLIEVTEMLKITPAKNIHIVFGRMSFPEKKMSTRKGNILSLEEVLDEAQERAYKIVQEKNPDLSDEKKREISKQVGIGAVKYSVLSQNRLTDVTFTWDKMLSLEGNSAPYIQYVYARACSILRKAAVDEKTDDKEASAPHYTFKEPQELAIARMFPKFGEIIAKSAEEFKPNVIANYLYDLAGRFNSFYAALPVIQAEDLGARAGRIFLTKAVTVILKNGLDLLGIGVPEEM